MKKQIAALLSVLFLASCDGPVWLLAGGELSGQETALVDMPTSSGIIQLETLPDDPYSVNVSYILLEGVLYLDPAEGRQWYQNILSNPAVRIRFDGSDLVHPILAVRETDPTILAQFDAERIILRLEPR